MRFGKDLITRESQWEVKYSLVFACGVKIASIEHKMLSNRNRMGACSRRSYRQGNSAFFLYLLSRLQAIVLEHKSYLFSRACTGKCLIFPPVMNLMWRGLSDGQRSTGCPAMMILGCCHVK